MILNFDSKLINLCEKNISFPEKVINTYVFSTNLRAAGGALEGSKRISIKNKKGGLPKWNPLFFNRKYQI